MNVSRPFIERPIGTTLLAIGLFLIGAVAYLSLPVASLPAIEFPTIRVTANLPGGDPETMAARVAAPLERRLGEIPGVSELTSVNALGVSRIVVQFEASRDIVGAAQDVQAAINAAAVDLPADMPSLPTFRKANPAAAPVLIMALTSNTMPPDKLYDVADTVIVQRLSQVEGVAEVTAAGAEQPAVRVRVNPMLLSSMGLSIEAVRTAISQANALAPLGFIEGAKQAIAIESNAQLGMRVDDYKRITVKTDKGEVVRLGDVAEVTQATRNSRAAAMFNRQPAILLNVTKSADANVIETVDRIHALLPELKRAIPEGIDFTVVNDRTTTLRASVQDMQKTLALSIVLVMLVVYLFLRRSTPTIAAGITVPLSLAGTCAAMWTAGFSVNNLTLMALAVSVGFVVDDAIVMIENMFRNLERGVPPLRAAIDGARQIGFTVIAISVSLIAAFIPLLFNSNVAGRLMREFSVTLAFAVVVSTVVSLTVTPMICAHFVRHEQTGGPDRWPTPLDRLVEGTMDWAARAYAATLDVALRHRFLTMLVMLATVVATVNLYINTPKGTFPQDDTGLVIASTQAATDISFEAMAGLQGQALDIVLADPAVENVGSSVGASGWNASVNQGRMFISLKPLKERDGLSTQRVINRLRQSLQHIQGLSVYFFAARDIRTGGRQGSADYQFTFWSPDFEELYAWVPKVVDRLKEVPGLVDVSTDRETGGLQATITVNRQAAARLGVNMQDVNNALNNAFSQRQVAILYTDRNQYRVILEVDPRYQRDPSDLNRIFVPGAGGVQIPLTSVVGVTRTLAPLVVNHQGPFPAVTINYGVAPDLPLAEAQNAIRQAIAELRMPDSIRAEAAGDAKAFEQEATKQALLIISALLAVYIVLGVLYESLAHPLTIISTLPAAGLGALVALRLWGMELTVIAFIGIILLIGIVKKNGIMLVDFALEMERERALSAANAIREACLTRFRPIMMTTFAALLGAIPLAIATGPGSELRRPLGITIIGGLIVSQILTLYTTPVIYLMLDRLHRRLSRTREPVPARGVA
ncbi:MAG: efflux RND transporter permease subunit [Hyphomicrobiaceae bacterium]|nr:efflux RND transporter permease subunit [Hyphomicrobiaceae bacterium]